MNDKLCIAICIIYILSIISCNSDITYTYVSPSSECGSSCNGTQESPYLTIKDASDNRRSNNLMLLSGTYTGAGNINLTISQLYTKITTEYPNDPSRVIIDCESNGYGFDLRSENYFINGITIKNCIASPRNNIQIYKNLGLGGGLFLNNLGIANISNCIFEDNEADIGGAIFIYAAVVNLDNTIIRNNKANNMSGGVHVQNAGYLRLLDETVIEDNYAKGKGGGMYVKAADIGLYDDTKIKSNTADAKGNNIYCNNGNVNLYDESDIDSSIVCYSCAIKQYDDDGNVKSGLFGGDQPSNNGKGMSKSGEAYLIVFLILFVIGVIIACFYFYKKRKENGGTKYQGLLET